MSFGDPVEFTRDLASERQQRCGNRVQVEDADGNAINAANPLPIGDAGGSITVDQVTHDELNANVNLQVNDTDVSAANPVPGDVITMPADGWTALITVTLDDDPTSYSSPAHNVAGESAVWVLIGIDSTGTPTDVRILAQISHDGGTSWWDFEEGLWASLYWEDTDTANQSWKAYLLPVGGVDLIRFRAIATGTNANNYFEVAVAVRSFRGNFGVAHA